MAAVAASVKAVDARLYGIFITNCCDSASWGAAEVGGFMAVLL
jgi:hypothetical protein